VTGAHGATPRHLLFIASASLIALAACGEVDRTGLTGVGSIDPSAGDPAPPGGDSGTNITQSGEGGAAPGSGGDGGGGGSGSDAGVRGAFANAPAFVSVSGTSARRSDHNFLSNTPTNSPAKQACFSCHGGGGAPSMVFGGTIFADAAGTMPLANAEIRVVAASGTAYSTHSDQDGNFFVFGTPLQSGSAGARDATDVHLMARSAPSGDCNSSTCHGGPQGWIHLP
jgi:hypothetical protein